MHSRLEGENGMNSGINDTKADIEKTLLDQILDEMFKSLELQKEFNKEIIIKLKQLAQTNDLGVSKKLTEVLKTKRGNLDEDS